VGKIFRFSIESLPFGL